ncbi:HMGS [Symbiodinium sp. CCMP2592]|nr:HMGS [Symbiodinium sp. CCMP2592]
MAIHTEATLEEEDIPGSNVTHLSECELATDQEVLTAFQTCQRLSRTMPKDQFAMYQQAAGITHNQHSMLLDQALLDQNILRPVSGYIHDWMHTMASQGVMQKSIWLLLSTTNAWDHMESFLQLWTMPGALAKAGKLHDLFTPKRTKFYGENQRFKCTASECLGLTTLLQYMVQRLWLPAGIQVDQCHSFLAMAQVQEMLQATHMGTVQDALTIFKRAGNEAAMVRKHHWMLHLSTQLEAMGFLPNCWPLERKHKVVTMYATNMMKIPVFSQSLLEEVLAHDIHAVQTSDSFEESAHLVQKRHPSAQLHKYLCESVFKAAIAKDHIWTAAAAMLETGGQVHQKDYVLIQQENQWGWQIAKVECHFEAADLVCSVVRTSDLVEYDAATYSALAQDTASFHFVLTEKILCPVIWAAEGQRVRILIPWSFRPGQKIAYFAWMLRAHDTVQFSSFSPAQQCFHPQHDSACNASPAHKCFHPRT